MVTEKKKVSATAQPHERYSLATVSRLTGLTPDVIRVWERRYGVVQPERGPRGARIYRASDIERLHLLAAVVASGRAIGDVARLSNRELSALLHAGGGPISAKGEAGSGVLHQPSASQPAAGVINERIMAAVQVFDQAQVEQILGDALVALGPIGLAQRVLAPLLDTVGEQWMNGALTVAHEHFLSAILRNFVAGILRNRIRASSRPTVLLATPEGEQHEFGLLLATLVLADAGQSLCYLGTQVPTENLLQAAHAVGAAIVALSAVNTANRARAVKVVEQILALRSPKVKVWLGGRDAATVARLAGGNGRVTVVSDISEIESLLRELPDLPRQPSSKTEKE